jgi:hypothetical protein
MPFFKNKTSEISIINDWYGFIQIKIDRIQELLKETDNAVTRAEVKKVLNFYELFWSPIKTALRVIDDDKWNNTLRDALIEVQKVRIIRKNIIGEELQHLTFELFNHFRGNLYNICRTMGNASIQAIVPPKGLKEKSYEDHHSQSSRSSESSSLQPELQQRPPKQSYSLTTTSWADVMSDDEKESSGKSIIQKPFVANELLEESIIQKPFVANEVLEHPIFVSRKNQKRPEPTIATSSAPKQEPAVVVLSDAQVGGLWRFCNCTLKMSSELTNRILNLVSKDSNAQVFCEDQLTFAQLGQLIMYCKKSGYDDQIIINILNSVDAV